MSGTDDLLDKIDERDATIATLTAQLAEERAMRGAVLERAANCTEWTAWGQRHNLTEAARRAIRALDPDASAALAEYVRTFKEREEKAEAVSLAWQKRSIEGWQAFSAMRDSINEVLPIPSPENDLARGPELSVSCEVVAAAVIQHTTAAEAEAKRLREAITPSGDTKAAYMGEFSFPMTVTDEDGNESTVRVPVPWDTIKEIMAAIRTRALLEGDKP